MALGHGLYAYQGEPCGFFGLRIFSPWYTGHNNRLHFPVLWSYRLLHFRPGSGLFCRSFVRRYGWYFYLPQFERLRRNFTLLQVFKPPFPKGAGSDCLSGDALEISIFFPYIEGIFSIRHFFRVFFVGFCDDSAGYRTYRAFVFLSVWPPEEH